MIKARGILFLVAALAVAFLAAVMVSRLLNETAQTKVRLVVAGIDIAPGDRLTSGMLNTVAWPGSNVPRDAFHDVREPVGRVAANGMRKGELINENRLVPRGESRVDRPSIPPGMRAVSMEIDGVSGVSGMLNPGDRIDVIATNPLPGGKNQRISRVILSRVRVLTCGDSQEGGKTAGKKDRKSVVTLLLSPDDARALASSEGAKLRLVKRNPSDDAEGDPGTTVFSISLGPQKASELRAMAAAKDEMLNGRIEEGKRAVTVSFKDDDGICGFIRSGNRVDVVAITAEGNISVEGTAPGSKAKLLKTSKMAKIILQNIEVMAVEQKVASPADILAPGDKKKKTCDPEAGRACGEGGVSAEGKFNPKNVAGANRFNVIGKITFLLTPEDAEKLIVAYNSEFIKIICRNDADDQIVNTTGQKLVEAFWGKNKRYGVEIYRGLEEWGLAFDEDGVQQVEPPVGASPQEENPIGRNPL